MTNMTGRIVIRHSPSLHTRAKQLSSPKTEMMHRLLFCLLLVASAPLAEAINYPRPLPSAYNNIYPFYLIGQVFFKSGPSDYIGSGTVAGAHSVLTAGHNVYDPDTGFST